MRVEKNFIVVPGPVNSKFDGDRHYISATRLMDLYRVKREECVVIENSRNAYLYGRYEGCLILEPRYHGDYDLPDVLVDPCWEHQQNGLWIQFKIADVLATFTRAFS